MYNLSDTVLHPSLIVFLICLILAKKGIIDRDRFEEQIIFYLLTIFESFYLYYKIFHLCIQF